MRCVAFKIERFYGSRAFLMFRPLGGKKMVPCLIGNPYFFDFFFSKIYRCPPQFSKKVHLSYRKCYAFSRSVCACRILQNRAGGSKKWGPITRAPAKVGVRGGCAKFAPAWHFKLRFPAKSAVENICAWRMFLV